MALWKGATKPHGTRARGGRGGEGRKVDEVSAATRNAAVSKSKCQSALHADIVSRQSGNYTRNASLLQIIKA